MPSQEACGRDKYCLIPKVKLYGRAGFENFLFDVEENIFGN
jgi:hypothetical protein